MAKSKATKFEMKIHCRYDELLELSKFKTNPKNPNKHTKDQIKALGALFVAHGIRHPIIVSKRSGLVVAGHGRLEAASLLEFKIFPVSYQDFESEEKEYAFLVADNAIADWAELDLPGIKEEIMQLGPDLDKDWFGVKDLFLPLSAPKEKKEASPKQVQCPICGHGFEA